MIDRTQVAGMEPAVFGKGILRCLFILIISFHHILSANLDLPYLIIWIVGIDADFHYSFQYLSTRTRNVFIVMIVADQRAALCHSVTDRKREFDLIKEIRHLLVHGGTTDNHFTETASHCIHEMFAYLRIDT